MKKKMMTIALCSALSFTVLAFGNPGAQGSMCKPVHGNGGETTDLGSDLPIILGLVLLLKCGYSLARHLDARVICNLVSGNGLTSLMEHIRDGDTLYKELLICGASVTAVDNNGKTALHYAVEYDDTGDGRIVSLLLHYKSDCDVADNNGMTPLMTAVSCNNKTVCKMLLGSGANIYAADNTGKRALEYAAENGDKNLIKLFFSKDVECKTKDEMTQIGLSEEVQKLLLDENIAYHDYLVKQSIPYARVLESKKMAEPQIFSILSGVYGNGINRSDVQEKIREKLLTPKALQERTQEMNAAILKAKIKRLKAAEAEIGGLC